MSQIRDHYAIQLLSYCIALYSITLHCIVCLLLHSYALVCDAFAFAGHLQQPMRCYSANAGVVFRFLLSPLLRTRPRIQWALYLHAKCHGLRKSPIWGNGHQLLTQWFDAVISFILQGLRILDTLITRSPSFSPHFSQISKTP